MLHGKSALPMITYKNKDQQTQSRFINLGIIAIGDSENLCGVGILFLVGKCEMSGTTLLPIEDNQKCPQTLSNTPWGRAGEKWPTLRAHWYLLQEIQGHREMESEKKGKGTQGKLVSLGSHLKIRHEGDYILLACLFYGLDIKLKTN